MLRRTNGPSRGETKAHHGRVGESPAGGWNQGGNVRPEASARVGTLRRRSAFTAIDEALAEDAIQLEVDWSAVRRDPEFLALLLVYQTTSVIDRQRMIAVIERNVGPASPGGSANEVAEQLTDLIIRLAFRAMTNDRAGIHGDLARTRHTTFSQL